MRRGRRALLAVAACGLALFAGVIAAGAWLSRPALQPVGAAPADLQARPVQIALAPGREVSGWFARGQSGAGAVLLLHGVRANRTQMLQRARFLHAAGHAVLLIDLPGHGRSPADRITFGEHESRAVVAALDHLRRELPGERVGVIAVSLGAAALVLARARPAPQAVVLESMYATIDEAVANRLALRLGPLGAALAPLLLWQLPLRLGIDAGQLRPIDAMPALTAPLLLASGTLDQHTPWPETERLFAAARGPKTLWPVAGAAHVDLHAFDPAAYEARVLPFLTQHLRRDGAALR